VRTHLFTLWRLVALAVFLQLTLADADTAPPPATHFDLNRPDIRDFIHEVATRNDLSPRVVRALLRHAVPQIRVIERTEQPAERVLASRQELISGSSTASCSSASRPSAVSRPSTSSPFSAARPSTAA
jgi:hypothetical protein